MMKVPRSSKTSRCSCDKSIIVEYDPYREFGTEVLFTGCPLDKSISSSAATCACVHKHALKVNAPSTADAFKDGDVDGVERDLEGVCLEERMNLAPRGVRNRTPGAALGRTDSACSSNRSEESPVVSQCNRLFRQMQKLRTYYLADLWAILKEFKGQLEVYLYDGPVAVIIGYHIDILQRMIAPMVAERKALVSWLSEETVEQLRRQTLQYVGSFAGEKFQSAFQQLVARQTRWIVPGQAEQADCIQPDHSENKYGGAEDNKTEAHVVALSTSGEDADPIANNVSAKMTSFKDGHGLSARKEAAFGTIKRSCDDGRDVEISSNCLAERDFCPPQCKRLKTMDMREVEFRQEAEDREAKVINHESGNELFGAKPDDFVRSVGQHAPSTNTASQAVVVAETSRDTQMRKATSFKKFIGLFNADSASLPCLKSVYEGICRRS